MPGTVGSSPLAMIHLNFKVKSYEIPFSSLFTEKESETQRG